MISIHALREERDQGIPLYAVNENPDFNPRAPRGARPAHSPAGLSVTVFSIHALREERDDIQAALKADTGVFNPRAPRGARPEQGSF